MLLDLIDLSKLRRAIVYAIALVVALTLQNLIIGRVALFGVRALLVPSMVAAVALFEGGLWGGMLGLAAGYFMDMAYVDHVVLFTVLLPAIGFFTGALGKYMLHKGFVSYMTLALVTMTIITFLQMFRFLFFLDADTQAFRALYLGGRGLWTVLRTGLVQIIWSLVWAVPIYFPCKAIAARPMGR